MIDFTKKLTLGNDEIHANLKKLEQYVRDNYYVLREGAARLGCRLWSDAIGRSSFNCARHGKSITYSLSGINCGQLYAEGVYLVNDDDLGIVIKQLTDIINAVQAERKSKFSISIGE